MASTVQDLYYERHNDHKTSLHSVPLLPLGTLCFCTPKPPYSAREMNARNMHRQEQLRSLFLRKYSTFSVCCQMSPSTWQYKRWNSRPKKSVQLEVSVGLLFCLCCTTLFCSFSSTQHSVTSNKMTVCIYIYIYDVMAAFYCSCFIMEGKAGNKVICMFWQQEEFWVLSERCGEIRSNQILLSLTCQCLFLWKLLSSVRFNTNG